jgi:GNAT superfamily N-acetyltransferase
MLHCTNIFPGTVDVEAQVEGESTRGRAVLYKELGPWAGSLVLDHLLGLDRDARYLRFGAPVNDDLILRYVEGLRWERDDFFGAFSGGSPDTSGTVVRDVMIAADDSAHDGLALVGFAHLAMLSFDGESGRRDLGAEFSVSVDAARRGHGIGATLFERGAVRAMNRGARRMQMQCLTQNGPMLRIAHRAGMRVVRHGDEAEACVLLPAADEASKRLDVATEIQAQMDPALVMLKIQAKNLRVDAVNAWAPGAETSRAADAMPC